MEAIMTRLTLEEQAVVGPVRISRMTALGTGFAGVVCIDFDGHTARNRGCVGVRPQCVD